MTSMVQYGSFDLEDVDGIDEELAKGGGSYIKLAVGKNVVRFIPPLPGTKGFLMVHEHQLNLPNGDYVSFACPRLMAKKRCMICRKADKLKTTGNPADYDKAKEIFARKRIYSNVIDRRDEETGPKVFAFGIKIWTQLKVLRQDEDVGGDFTDPKEGFDIIINRTGTGKNDTEYAVIPARTSPLGDEEWIKEQGSLARFAAILSEEEMRKRLGGRDKKDDGGGKQRRAEEPPAETVMDADFEEVGDDDIPFA